MLNLLRFLILVFLFTNCACECPKVGESANPPDILNLISSQTGYTSWIEFVHEGVIIARFEETYYEDIEKVELTSLIDDKSYKFYFFYGKNNEVYYVDKSNQCQTLSSDPISGETATQSIIRIVFNKLYNYGDLGQLFGKIISPVGLLIALSKRQDGQLKVFNDIQQYHFCKDNQYKIVAAFGKENLPQYATIELTSQTKSTINLRMNYILFKPRSERSELITYPYEYGCQRLIDSQEIKFPEFAGFSHSKDEDLTFYMELEANILNQNQIKREKARIVYSENVTAIEKVNYRNQISRIVYDLNTRVKYLIESNNCSSLKYYLGEKIEWPIHETKFNLLYHLMWQPENLTKISYYGQKMINNKKVNIFGRILDRFFDYRKSARIIYFFEVKDDDDKTIQAPILVKIDRIINKVVDKSFSIDLNVIYVDSKIADNYHLLDISNCYLDRYNWLQISFTDSMDKMLQLYGRDVEIIDSFRTQLHSYIKLPEIRTPQIITSFYGNSLYITIKLLESPRMELIRTNIGNFVLQTYDYLNYRDSAVDCAAICPHDRECDFSYCSDGKCLIACPSKDRVVLANDSCVTYLSKRDYVKYNLLYQMANSKVLVTINQQIRELFVELDKERLFADEAYFVKSGEDVGKVNEENSHPISIMENEYELNVIKKKIIDSDALRPIGLTYNQCIMECDDNNDCNSVSYCSGGENECLLSGIQRSDLNDKNTLFDENCNIFSRKYLSLYNQFDGQALVMDAMATIETGDSENCARECSLRKDFECNSFDLCSNTDHYRSKETVCFMHTHHVAKSGKNAIDSTIWNVTNSKCTHYSKKYSQEFVQRTLRKLKDDKLPVLLVGKSLESCANECLDNQCRSFEFCENRRDDSKLDIDVTCRISDMKAIDGVSMRQAQKSGCSVYIAKNDPKTAQISEIKSSKIGLAIGWGLFFFLIAALVGAAASYRYTTT